MSFIFLNFIYIYILGLQQHPSSALLASAGLIPDTVNQSTSTMISLTNEPSNTLPPAAAAALIQQQHNHQQQQIVQSNSTPITTQQASTVNESIQQQIVASHVGLRLVLS